MSYIYKINWGEKDYNKRGPIIFSGDKRNCIGAYSGSYSIYKALAYSKNNLQYKFKPDLKNTEPVFEIIPNDNWYDPNKIVTFDPLGHLTIKLFNNLIKKNHDIKPTIAVTKAHLDIPEIKYLVENKKLIPDNKILNDNCQINIKKVAIDQIWYLKGIAKRLGINVNKLRKDLYDYTNGMYQDLINRPELEVFVPPIGGITVYIMGELKNKEKELTLRVHDECNGSDVFGSDICTCRPYLMHAFEECIKTAQNGGCGIVVYFRKEGRALGEVTKYLVYNKRKRQEKGDTAKEYFSCTEKVAGIQDVRYQCFMPDVLNWLGIKKIHNLISMSDMKYNAIINNNIEILNRISLPTEKIPEDAHVEINAKIESGYFQGDLNDPNLDIKGRK